MKIREYDNISVPKTKEGEMSSADRDTSAIFVWKLVCLQTSNLSVCKLSQNLSAPKIVSKLVCSQTCLKTCLLASCKLVCLQNCLETCLLPNLSQNLSACKLVSKLVCLQTCKMVWTHADKTCLLANLETCLKTYRQNLFACKLANLSENLQTKLVCRDETMTKPTLDPAERTIAEVVGSSL